MQRKEKREVINRAGASLYDTLSDLREVLTGGHARPDDDS
jgi:hypothetical protein